MPNSGLQFRGGSVVISSLALLLMSVDACSPRPKKQDPWSGVAYAEEPVCKYDHNAIVLSLPATEELSHSPPRIILNREDGDQVELGKTSAFAQDGKYTPYTMYAYLDAEYHSGSSTQNPRFSVALSTPALDFTGRGTIEITADSFATESFEIVAKNPITRRGKRCGKILNELFPLWKDYSSEYDESNILLPLAGGYLLIYDSSARTGTVAGRVYHDISFIDPFHSEACDLPTHSGVRERCHSVGFNDKRLRIGSFTHHLDGDPGLDPETNDAYGLPGVQ